MVCEFLKVEDLHAHTPDTWHTGGAHAILPAYFTSVSEAPRRWLWGQEEGLCEALDHISHCGLSVL